MAIGPLKRPQYCTALQTNDYNSNTVREQATKKSSRGCPNECFESGENPKFICQSLATNMKAFSQQNIDCSERTAGKDDVN